MKSLQCSRSRQAVDARSIDATAEIPDELALHLDECGKCRQLFDATRLELPPAAFERLGEDRRQAIAEALANARSAQRWRRTWLATAAVAVVTVAVAGLLFDGGQGDDLVATALVDDHVRYLHDPARRSSADPASVAADLQGHVDFPVRLPDPPGSRLTGGRRCYLLGRRVGLAFYETPAGSASYFVLDAEGLDRPGEPCPSVPELACRLMKGYRVVTWQTAGLLHAVVGPDHGALQATARAAWQGHLAERPNERPNQ